MDRSNLRPNAVDWIGSPLVRREDDRLIQGRGRFVDDLSPPDCLFLEFVRSSHARGRIRGMAVQSSCRSPGVVAVFTGEHVAGLGGVSVNPLVPGMRSVDFSILAQRELRAVGQPIAAVVGESTACAKDAAELLQIDVEPIDNSGLLGVEAFSHEWAAGDVDHAFTSAKHVAALTIHHPRVAPLALEPRATLAEWEPNAGTLTVWLSTQTPHRAKMDFAKVLGLAEERVRVIAPDVGGAFGGKASIYPEDVMVAFASMQLSKPVKWCATRSEDFLAATHGRGAVAEGELALSEDGRFLGLRAKLRFPLGHWLPYSAAAPANNAGRILPGPYQVGAVHIRIGADLSETTAVNIYRGAGRPEAAMLMERLVDEAARIMSCDPMELRRINLIQPNQFPYRTATGEVLDSGNYPLVLQTACARARYDDLPRERDSRRNRGALCGIGTAFYIEPCGRGYESASVHLHRDGSIVAATGSSTQGQGRETTFAQIVADLLCLAPKDIIIRHGDTATTPTGIGALASRSTAIGGSALFLAAQEFCDNARRVAAHLLRTACEQIALVPGGFEHVGGLRHISWSEIAQAAQAGLPQAICESPDLRATATFQTDVEAWSNGCCIAAVEIDRETGAIRIEELTWVDDAGVVINPLLVEGQLIGGMAQGLGEALMEQVIYDGSGELLTGSLMDYAVPRAADVPPVLLDKIETPSTANLLGVKGVGEAGCIGIPAAIVNAVVDALSPLGIRHLDMPLTSAKIWRALDEHTKCSMQRNAP